MNFTFFARNTGRKKINAFQPQQVRKYGMLCSKVLPFIIKSSYSWLKQILILIFFSAILVLGCDKEKKENKLLLKYQNYVLGGCYVNNTKSMREDQQDTVMFSIVNDTLVLHCGMQYNCCGKLSNAAVVDENRITIKVVDQSTSMCKCLCYYTSDFRFTKFQTGTYTYKVLIKECLTTDFKVFKEGSVYVIKQ